MGSYSRVLKGRPFFAPAQLNGTPLQTGETFIRATRGASFTITEHEKIIANIGGPFARFKRRVPAT